MWRLHICPQGRFPKRTYIKSCLKGDYDKIFVHLLQLNLIHLNPKLY